jgi:primosomal protein N' (replication factor Y)
MKTQGKYADVVVPLPVPKLLTYGLMDQEEEVLPGMRVVVQVGTRKRYIAIVWQVHDNPPTAYAPRPLEAVVDAYSIVPLQQRKLWDWMASHYMCTRGEVMAAALPAGLKLNSQTRFLPHPEPPNRQHAVWRELDERSMLLYESVVAQGGIQLSEAAAIVDLKNPQRLLNGLMEHGLIVSEEEWKERYKPKMANYVCLTADFQEEEVLTSLLDELERRAPKQARVLTGFLSLCQAQKWDAEFLEKDLIESADADTGAVRRMVDKGIFERTKKPEASQGMLLSPQVQPLPILSEEQARAYRELTASHQTGKRTALLHGVTGSGKTEVYIHLIADALEKGQTVLFLVPEIALTTQLIQRLELHFKRFLQVYHSRFTTRERTETWLEVLGKKGSGSPAQLVVGPRSAMFLPFQNLGLIIVDEEHEASFKQHDPAPRYQARDAAMWLSREAGGFLVLGSATPSVETHWLAEEGRIDRVEMTERYGGILLPEIWCADLKKAQRQRAMTGHFTRLLKLEIEKVLDSNRQVILFQNRRGFAPIWQCGTCAWIPECERCDVPLTVHKWKNELNCHHCGYHVAPPPQLCGSCGKKTMEPKGLGTERVEEELQELFPKARVARMDRDTTRSRHGHERLVRAFANQEYDVLVGTQMVSKGLDFAHVGLVGVLSADRMLNFPDFRSFERAFQMLTQVAGRAGRSGQRGKVILQTYNPDHWVMAKVMANDYHGLVRQELIERKNYRYPPFDRLIRLTLKHSDERRLDAASEVLAGRLRQRFAARAIGPETPQISKINDLYHRVILLKFERSLSPKSYKELLAQDLDAFQSDDRFKRIRLTVDVDPS